MNSKIMSKGNLEDIVGRLTCCCALLDALRWAMDDSDVMVDALAGARDLLDTICRDFQSNIEAAEDYAEKEKGAA